MNKYNICNSPFYVKGSKSGTYIIISFDMSQMYIAQL